MSLKPYFEQDGIVVYHGDCREILPQLPKVDLVLTDPPYGIGECSRRVASREQLAAPKDYGFFDWDKHPVAQDLLDDVIAKGRKSVVWGGNYFALPPSPSWLVWDKLNSGDFADCELAWSNLGCAVRKIAHRWNGMIRDGKEERFHPTQKPLKVILWALSLAKGPDTILDPFMGSGTTLVAAKQLGRKAVGIELEERYCEIAVKRILGTTPSLFAEGA